MIPWDSLPIDIVGHIFGYTGKIKRRGDRFADQLDLQSPLYDSVKETLQRKVEAKRAAIIENDTYYVEIPIRGSLGVIYDNKWHGRDFMISFYRDRRKGNFWYGATDVFYRVFGVYHPYYFIVNHTYT